MAENVFRELEQLDFSFGELSGALGDSITVLPLVVAIGALSDLSIGTILIGFGVFQIIWGVYYGIPISVEPMKALAALIIAGTLSTRGFLLAGFLAGIILLFIGRFRMLERIQAFIGEPVVRGVQFAVALLLLETGLQLGLQNILIALLALGIVLVLGVTGWHKGAPLVVLGLGAAITISQVGLPALSIPIVSTPLLSNEPIKYGSVIGATLGQLVMTVGNAAVATSLLLADYYDAKISPDELSTSMGLMNLLAVPLGMIPMCHGSGGVAGKYTFGARTAGSNLILGGLYVVIAVFAGGLVMAFPLSILGVILVVIALGLARTGLDSDHLGITLFVGVVSILSNVGVGFLSGLILYLIIRRSKDDGNGRSPSHPA